MYPRLGRCICVRSAALTSCGTPAQLCNGTYVTHLWGRKGEVRSPVHGREAPVSGIFFISCMIVGLPAAW